MHRHVHVDLSARSLFFGRSPWGRLALAVIVLVGLGGCDSHGSSNQGIGPLSEIVFHGPADGWTGSMETGVYWLENTAGDRNDIRYFYTAPVPNSDAKRSAHVDVLTASMYPEGRAGLLYGYRESPRFYYLIMVSGSGDVEIFERDGGNFDRLQSSSIDATKKGSVRIGIEEKGRELTVFANGRAVSTLENDRIGAGLIGIAAFGNGRFGFTNYVQDPSPASAAAQRKAVSERPSQPASQSMGKAATIKRSDYIDYIDSQSGIVQLSAPFPAGWRYDDNPNDQLLLTGPNGTRVYQASSGQFLYSDDASARQSAQMSGAQVAPFMPLSRYLSQKFESYMGQRGYTLSRQFPLPQVVALMEIVAAGMPQGLSTKRFDALGAEWRHSDGSKAYTQLTQTLLLPRSGQAPAFLSWNVSAMELYAAREHFESARDALIHASANAEINPRWQIAKNKELLAKIRADKQFSDERSRQSRIQHIGRMNAILARAESSSSVARINSDILDISHAGYLKRSDMVSAGQARSIDAISGQSVITNPNTGELYKVDSGYQNYWVNAEGKYFHTDDALYDPRTDKQISSQQWQRFDVVR